MSKNEKKLVFFMFFVTVLIFIVIVIYNINLNWLDRETKKIKKEIVDKNKKIENLNIEEENVKNNYDLYKNQKESISNVIKGLEEKINEE